MDILPELSKPLTLSEHKKMMGKLFTYRNNQVRTCGHKFHEVNEPRTQCPDCWAAFFFTHGETSAIADEVFQKGGKDLLIKLKGRVFTKWFIRFMVEIQKKLKEQKGIDGQVSREDRSGDDPSGEMASAYPSGEAA